MPDFRSLFAPTQAESKPDYNSLFAPLDGSTPMIPEPEEKSPLPDWAATIHEAIDPKKAFGGTIPLLAMALPAGTGHPIPTGAPMRPNLAPKIQVGEAANRLGVEFPNFALPGQPVRQRVAQGLSDTPFTGKPIEAASQRAHEQLGEAVNRTEQGYGGVGRAQAGADARDSITNYMRNTTKAEQSKLYDAVDQYVPPTVTGPLPSTRTLVANLSAQRQNAALPPSEVGKIVEDALNRPGMNYQGIKQLRTSVGEMLDVGPVPAGMSNGELKLLYGALTDDMKAIVAKGGPNAIAAFEKANSYSATVAQERQNLYRIVGAKSDEAVTDRILAAASTTARGDIALLQQARAASSPQAWEGVASASIARLGRNPATGEFSPDRFLTNWAKITPQGKAILFRSTGKNDLARSLDDIATVSSAFKEVSKYTNTSRTGSSTKTTALLAGAFGAPLTTLSTVLSGRVVSHLLSKPVTARAIARWSRAYASGSAKAIALASKPLAFVIGRELGTPGVVPRITRELSGANANEQPDQME